MFEQAAGAVLDPRLEMARSVLRLAQLGSDDEDGRLLPVAEPLRQLLPRGGLRRGSTVAVQGSTSLLLALLAEASADGAWSAVVGLPALGLVAAAEAGVRLERLALVPDPGADLVAVTAALLDGLDLVAVAGVARLGAAQRQRLMARARTRGSVLLPIGPWPGADVVLSCTGGRWLGLTASFGGGRLTARQVEVRAAGRGSAVRAQVAEVTLPLGHGAAMPLGPMVALPAEVATGPGMASEPATDPVPDVRRRAG